MNDPLTFPQFVAFVVAAGLVAALALALQPVLWAPAPDAVDLAAAHGAR